MTTPTIAEDWGSRQIDKSRMPPRAENPGGIPRRELLVAVFVVVIEILFGLFRGFVLVVAHFLVH